MNDNLTELMHPKMDLGSATPLNENQMPYGDIGNDYYDSSGEIHNAIDNIKDTRSQVVDAVNC